MLLYASTNCAIVSLRSEVRENSVEDIEVRGYYLVRLDAGTLSFEYNDGSARVFAPGTWTKFELSRQD